VIYLNDNGVYCGVKYQLEVTLRSAGAPSSNKASIFGLRGMDGIAHYVVVKHAVAGATLAVGNEHAVQNSRVNDLCPGATETPNYIASNCVDARFFLEKMRWGERRASVPKGVSPRQVLAGIQHGLDRERRCDHVD